MKEVERKTFLLQSAMPFLESVAPESRQFLGSFYMCVEKAAVYSVRFVFTDKWEVSSCVKWLS
jgi:hypothetical protein